LRNLPCSRLEELADVHAPGDAARVERDLDVLPVLRVGHLRIRENHRDDALVAVATGHLVTDLHWLDGAHVDGEPVLALVDADDLAVELAVPEHALVGVPTAHAPTDGREPCAV